MDPSLTELSLELARQHAINLIFDEFQKTPERSMDIIDFRRVGGNWVTTMSNVDFPDILIIVEYKAPPADLKVPGSVYTHLYERRTRSSNVVREEDALFNI